MKQIYALLFILIMFFLQAQAWDGAGTKSNPYKISSSKDLVELSTKSGYAGDHQGVYFEQTADVDMAHTTDFTSIGFQYQAFKGNYDGKNFKIKNLIVKKGGMENSTIALFGAISGDTIQNVHIEGVSIFEGNKYIASITGYAVDAVIKNCSSSAMVTANSEYSQYIGGIVGHAFNTKVEECCNTGVVTATGANASYIGGVVGQITNGASATGCYNFGLVTGTNYVGGVCGYIGSYELVDNCYNKGIITGTKDYTGGVFGYVSTGLLSTGAVTSCYNTGKVSGNNYTGGVVGSTANTTHSCNIGMIESTGKFVGGVAGSGNIYNCYNTAEISGKEVVGGLIGSLGEMYDCYNTGNVEGNSITGGIAGQMSGTENEMHNSYSVGNVTIIEEQTSIGGIAGYVNTGGFINSNKIKNVYWNSDIYAGYSVGGWNNTSSSTEKFQYDAKTTTDLKNNFHTTLGANWQKDAQNQNNGYPVLTGNVALLQPVSNSVYTITASTGENGSISNEGTLKTVLGSSYLYVIMPDEGYEIDQVLVNGENKDSNIYYKFENIDNDYTISVTFKLAGGSGLHSMRNDIDCYSFADGLKINNASGYELNLMDTSGKSYLKREITNNVEIIETFAFPKGVYIVELKREGYSKTFKVIR